MQVVLKKRVPKLGNECDVVNVKLGFARNFLFPQKLAVPASKHEITTATTMKAKIVQKYETLMQNAKEIAAKLKDAVLTFKKKARGEKLYGSLKEKDIVDAVLEQCKVGINKDMVHGGEHIKTVGEHTVILKIAEGVEVKVKVVIEKEE
jgi:large subunit ribosomal protein L9